MSKKVSALTLLGILTVLLNQEERVLW